MKKQKSEVFLMLAIVFAIITGILLAFAFMKPVTYQKSDETTSIVSTSQESTEKENAVASTKKVEYPININTATAEELMTIPNVGEKRAYAIVDYRVHLGGYDSVEQIMEIEGIGESTYSKIAGYLIV